MNAKWILNGFLGLALGVAGQTSTGAEQPDVSPVSGLTGGQVEKLKTLRQAFEQGVFSKADYDAKCSDVLDENIARGPESGTPPAGFVPTDRTPGNAGGRGYRVFTIGHSFHAGWLPAWLQTLALSAGLEAHTVAGVSNIGGSEVIQHWNVPDGTNQAKAALATGNVDVLTMSPKWRPDEGMEKFAALALEHNPDIRVTVQEFWMPFDELRDFGDLGKTLRTWNDPTPDPDPQRENRNTAHFDVPTSDQLRALHEPFFRRMDEHIVGLNRQFGKQVLFIVPVGQAVIALREMVAAGKVPGIARQSELFGDKLGHPKAPICALSAYCHFAVIYRRSPVGLPMPPQLAKDYNSPELNRLLQEIAWKAVTRHPLSGVSAP